MSAVEWVEVRGKDVDVAVAAAVEELGLDGPDAADVEVLQQPERGFLGMGGQDAIVRVKAKQTSSKRRRRGGRGRGNGKKSESKRDERDSKSSGGNSKKTAARKPQRASGGGEKKPRNDQSRQQRQPQRRNTEAARPKKEKEPKVEVEVDRGEQAEMVKDFLVGLLEAFGLEGDVECKVEEDIILANITGEQTEALVGPKGAILQSIMELSRTIVQRKSQAGARIRLDIGGYTERRREALRIYTGRLVEKVTEEGGEIMLEPMNAADRKVVHDAAADLGGVRTFSEGEEPRRSVVIAVLDDE
ncbi:MAG: RNA-binding cell elongation regulator Jag/EloR [Acidimicrobiia bacterium]